MDACRHGGMTELDEAELTDGQGPALSTHRTQQSYEGYAKHAAKRMLSATRMHHAHRPAERNEPGIPFRNHLNCEIIGTVGAAVLSWETFPIPLGPTDMVSSALHSVSFGQPAPKYTRCDRAYASCK